MHDSVMAWVGSVVGEYGLAGGVTLEVGSLNVNGSVRPLFRGHYTGIDMQDGPGVDEVASSHRIPYHDRVFDVVVSTEMLEHDSAPWLSVREMARVIRPGGHVIVTARGYDERGVFPVHGYPEDHWRYSVTGMRHLLAHGALDVLECVPDPQTPGVFALARRP